MTASLHVVEGKYGDSGDRTCKDCPTGCFACVSASNCTSCVIEGYYFDSWSCSECDDTCSVCSGSASTNCVSCPTGRILKSSTSECVQLDCDPQEYINYDLGECQACDESCVTCDGSTASDCLSCGTESTLLTDGTCIECISDDNFHTNCSEICGKGTRRTLQLECDDNNTIPGDGCSEECKVETNWTCSGGSLTSQDTCSRTDTAKITLSIADEDFEEVLLSFDRTMAINVTGDLSGELTIEFASVKPTDYYWVATFTNESQNILITFNSSVDIIDSTLYVTVVEPTRFTDTFGNPSEKRAELEFPNYYYYGPKVRGQIDDVEAVNWAIQIYIAAIILLLWAGGSIHWLWSLVDYLQYVYLLSFINVRYPLNLTRFLQSWKYMHILFIPGPFSPLKDGLEGQEGPSKFKEHDITANFLLNAGYIMAIVSVVFILHLMAFLLSRVKKYNRKWNQFITSIRRLFEWNVIIRVYLLLFAFLALSTFLQYSNVDFGGALSIVGFILALITTPLLVATPIVLHFLIKKWHHFARVPPKKRQVYLSMDSHSDFSTLCEEFRLDTTFKSAFLRVIVIKKLLFVLILVAISDSPHAQLVLLTILMVTVLLIDIFSRPMKNTFWNLREIVQDFVIFLVICLIYAYLEEDASNEFFISNGWDIIVLIYIAIGLNLLVLLFFAAKGLVALLKSLKRSAKAFLSSLFRGRRVGMMSQSNKGKKTKLVTKTRKRRYLRRKNAEGGHDYAAPEEHDAGKLSDKAEYESPTAGSGEQNGSAKEYNFTFRTEQGEPSRKIQTPQDANKLMTIQEEMTNPREPL